MERKYLVKCPICRTEYGTQEEAKECEKSHRTQPRLFDFCISGMEKYPHNIYMMFEDGELREYRIFKEDE